MKQSSAKLFNVFVWVFLISLFCISVLFLLPSQNATLISATSTNDPLLFIPLPPTYSALMDEVQTSRAKPIGTATPYPVTEIIDLAPNHLQKDKAKAIVLQANGNYYAVWFRYDKLPDLKEKSDRIVFIEPPESLFGHRPPSPTKAQDLTPGVIISPTKVPGQPYPAFNSTSVLTLTPTIRSYPAP